MPRYFSLFTSGNVAELNIYGDITSWPWSESDVSASNLSKQLEELAGVDEIQVHINSYGGEVAEGLAIYNALRRHNAKITTTCDGMACSIASVIFMAGDERIMSESSLLMIHNAWMYASGNASDLRKQADDLDTITNASKAAYLSRITIDESELTRMMDNETFITAEDAVTMGFATEIETYESEHPSQSARKMVSQLLTREVDTVEQSSQIYLDVSELARAIAGELYQLETEDTEDEPETETEDNQEEPDTPDDEEDDPKEDSTTKSAKEALFLFLSKEN